MDAIIQNPLQVESLTGLVDLILSTIIYVGTPLLVFVFMLIGFRYVTAQGDVGTIKGLHRQFLWTVVGAAVILGALVIEQVLQNTINEVKRDTATITHIIPRA